MEARVRVHRVQHGVGAQRHGGELLGLDRVSAGDRLGDPVEQPVEPLPGGHLADVRRLAGEAGPAGLAAGVGHVRHGGRRRAPDDEPDHQGQQRGPDDPGDPPGQAFRFPGDDPAGRLPAPMAEAGPGVQGRRAGPAGPGTRGARRRCRRSCRRGWRRRRRCRRMWEQSWRQECNQAGGWADGQTGRWIPSLPALAGDDTMDLRGRMYPSLRPSARPPVRPSARLPVCPSARLPACPPVKGGGGRGPALAWSHGSTEDPRRSPPCPMPHRPGTWAILPAAMPAGACISRPSTGATRWPAGSTS